MGGEETTGRSWPGVQEQLSRKSPREFKEEFLKCMLEMLSFRAGVRSLSQCCILDSTSYSTPKKSSGYFLFFIRRTVWGLGTCPCSYLTSGLESLRLFVRKKCKMLGTAIGGLKSECKYKFLFWPLSFLLMPSFRGSRHGGQGRVCWLQATRVSFRC